MALLLPHSAFFHIPKTGGCWIAHAMLRAGLQPQIGGCRKGCAERPLQSMTEYYRMCGTCKHSQPWSLAATEGRFLCTFVRHPYAYYRSLWLFKTRHGWRPDQELDRKCAAPTLREFVEWSTERMPGWLTQRYDRYTHKDGKLLPFIGRQESLVDDLIAALRIANEPFDEAALVATPLENTAVSAPDWAGDTNLTDDLRARIYTTERDIFDRYDYQP